MATENKKKKATMSSILSGGLPGGMASLINDVEKEEPSESKTSVISSNEGTSIEELLRYYKEKKGSFSKVIYVDEEVKSFLTTIRSTQYFGQFTAGQIVSAIVTDFFNKNKESIRKELNSKFE